MNETNNLFSWVKTHQELSNYLLGQENNQAELISLLKKQDITALNDQDIEGHQIELTEIDPFTFFCYIYKHGPEKRLKILQDIATELKLTVPNDDAGIPSANAQKVWLFPYKFNRKNDEIKRLWSFFKSALNNTITDEQFTDILKIKNTGKIKLTEALFYVDPKSYLPINGPTIPFLKDVLKINTDFKNYSDYVDILKKVKETTDQSFYQISYEAWLQKSKNCNYWIFQCNPEMFDLVTALDENLVDDWTVTAHKDKIKEGDKAIIWMTGEEAGCYALADITSEPAEKETSTDAHLWKLPDTSTLKVGLHITQNLGNQPILKRHIEKMPELQNLKAGNQGTNFQATQEQYEALLGMLATTSSDEYYGVKKSLDPEKLQSYFQILRNFLQKNSVAHNDPRISFTVRKKYNLLSFLIGRRYCLNISKKRDKTYLMFISKDRHVENSGIFVNNSKVTEAFWNDVESYSGYENDIYEGLLRELNRGHISNYRRNSNPEFIKDVYQIKINMKDLNHTKKYPLNTIFYGPPGTGKTYHTIKRAAEIISGESGDDYSEALKIFNEHLGSRIEFITFHQNYSYEDFIQGLRPDTENGNQLTFQKKDGIFKKIADKALKNLIESEKDPEAISKSHIFDEALEKLKDKIIDSEQKIFINETAYFIAVEDDALRYSADNWTLNDKGFNGFRMKYSDLKKFYEADIKSRKEIKELAGISGLAKQHASYFIKAYELVKSLIDEETYNAIKIERQNYVIIIDEINRANISRVFGELITLIEQDKRSHGEIPLQCTLPSGDEFIVPSNLYIIGTMNTADKSIALLDIALRRRFEFEAMYPLDFIPGKEIYDVAILKKINESIIKKKGHDFQIGHAYFMDNSQSLTDRMNKRVIPLLMEYFMNDEKEVTEILKSAALEVDSSKWPLQIMASS